MSAEAYFECCQAAKSLGHKDDCPSNAKNLQKITIAFDDPAERNVMQLTIPLKRIALDENGIQAMIELYGSFEVAKDTAISTIQVHRMRHKQSKPGLIIPGNGAKAPINLEVH